MHNFYFILVEPQVPENVGAAARALNTMGFSDLRLVNSTAHKKQPARWLAHGSMHILDNAGEFDSLNEALEDCDFIIGTTARFRIRRKDYHEPEKLVDIISGKGGTINRVAILFGREETGLTNEELDCCDIVSSIPLKAEYPSLNLGQAVMLYAYELSKLVLPNSEAAEPLKHEADQHRLLRQKAENLLTELNVPNESSLFRRVMERLGLLRDVDIHLAHTMINKMAQQWLHDSGLTSDKEKLKNDKKR